MSSSYRRTVEKLAAQAGDANRGLCTRCDTPTQRTTLAQYGGRCAGCFEAYCSEGMRGGAKGFVGGASDTPDQAEMRKHLKRSRPVGQAMARTDAEDDAEKRNSAKAETAKRVAEYTRRTGIAA